MDLPTRNITPKSREELWQQTIVGSILFLFGLVVIGGYVWHQLSPKHMELEHRPEVMVLLVGCVCSFIGLYWVNTKLAKEFMADAMKWVPLFRRGPDA